MQLLGKVLNDSLIDENLQKWIRLLNPQNFPNRIYGYMYGCLTWQVLWCHVTLAFVSSFRLPLGLYPPLSFSRGVGVTCHTSSHLAVHVIIADWCEQQEVWFVIPPKPFSPIGSFASQSRPVTSQGAHISALCHHYNPDIVVILMRMEEWPHNYISGPISVSPRVFTQLRPFLSMMNVDHAADVDLWVSQCWNENLLFNSTFCSALLLLCAPFTEIKWVFEEEVQMGCNFFFLLLWFQWWTIV